MSNVRVRIDKYLDGGAIDAGAVVSVRRLDDSPTSPSPPQNAPPSDSPSPSSSSSPNSPSTGTPRTPVKKALASLGRSSSVTAPGSSSSSITLEPGRYEFSALMPSGDLISRVEVIAPTDQEREIVLAAASSGHEWMSWQHALGNVASVNTLDQARSELRLPPTDWGIHAGWFTVPSMLGPATDPLALGLDAHLAAAVDGKRKPFVSHGIPLNAVIDPPFQSFRLPQAPSGPYDQPQFLRSYLLVGDKDGREVFSALPHPWRSADGSEAVVEILVGPDQPVDASPETTDQRQPWCVSVVARDPRVASVLSYFTAGEAESASLLADAAVEMLGDKMINPMAAAAGGYVLVDRWLREQQKAQRWLSWIDNLASMFPWLPDAAILRGWVRLAGVNGTPDLASARQSLLAADRAGVPLYTEGVRRLEAGLSRLAAQDRADGNTDPQLQSALQRARRFAWNADARYPFTTLRLWIDA
jgi:hypothetical protein